MKKGRVSSGYTIVEVMIVLAVSSALLVSGLLLVGNQQKKAELTSTANDIKQLVDGVINTVSSGYYRSLGDFTCTTGAAHPVITGGSSNLGTNGGCIFLGKAIQFGVAGDLSDMNVYSLAGLQRKASGEETDSLANAKPVAIAPGTSINTLAPTSAIESSRLGYGLEVRRVKYNGTVTSANTIAFVSDFAGTDSDGNLNSGSRTASLYAINSTLVSDNAQQAAEKIGSGNFTNDGFVTEATVCFDTGVAKFVILTIGKNGRQLSTTMKIRDDLPVPTECT